MFWYEPTNVYKHVGINYFSNWIVYFCHNRRKTSLEKFRNIHSTLNARMRARFSRCYIWCENNKRPSEDFHSKLTIDNRYVEVTLQTEYDIRKNSRKYFFLQFKFTELWSAERTRARARVSWCKNWIILSMWNGFSCFIMIKWQKFKRLSILFTTPKPPFNRKNMISCRK